MPYSPNTGESVEEVPPVSKWEALSLVPDRNIPGLVTRRWDRRMVRKPKMMVKKGRLST